MRHLLHEEGEKVLVAVMRRRPLLAFDFDGTLAPIVPKPDDARVPEQLVCLLTKLALLRPLGIITGRSVEDVIPRLGFVPHHVIGNHGAQDPIGLLRSSNESALEGFRKRIASQAEELQRAGVWIEDKRHSLALHFRSAPDYEKAKARINTLLQGFGANLKSFGGKYVVNILAADAPDKGDAIISLVRRAKTDCAVFVGDDVNDEAVFACAPKDWLTIRIGRDDPLSHAAFFLDDHGEMVILLEKMLALI